MHFYQTKLNSKSETTKWKFHMLKNAHVVSIFTRKWECEILYMFYFHCDLAVSYIAS